MSFSPVAQVTSEEPEAVPSALLIPTDIQDLPLKTQLEDLYLMQEKLTEKSKLLDRSRNVVYGK